MAYIEFKDVEKIYKMGEVDLKALDKANFEIEKGELVVILGQSGSGKSTCLNILGITILGILVGLILGTVYSYMLIDSIEINTMQYIKGIHLDSYLQTSGFMILFTIIVSIGVHFALKKINLIESLKSVE